MVFFVIVAASHEPKSATQHCGPPAIDTAASKGDGVLVDLV